MSEVSVRVTVEVDRSPADVYAYASNPENLPHWLTSFCKSIRQVEGQWVLDTTAGPMEIEFSPYNTEGILDHRVRLASGEEIVNTMRVVPRGSGSEVIFVLVRTTGMSAEQFKEDLDKVREDLKSLKQVLEVSSNA